MPTSIRLLLTGHPPAVCLFLGCRGTYCDVAELAHRGNGQDVHFNNGFTHIPNLSTRLPVNIRIAFEL